MPSDPAALLSMAARYNGLDGDGLHPWRIRISFQVLDDKGKTKQEGTVEESWAAGRRYKITYKSSAFNQVDYGTDQGVLRSGVQDPPPNVFKLVRSEFIQPIPSDKAREHWVLTADKRDAGKAKVLCVSLKAMMTSNGTRPVSAGPAFCMDKDKPELRVKIDGADHAQFLLNHIRVFQGRYVAEDIAEVRDGQQLLVAHLENLDPIENVDEAEFNPPADAVPVEKVITLAQGVAQGLLIKKVRPEYPEFAKRKGIRGTVAVQAIIGKDGSLSDVHAISGPEQLQQAAVNAVNQWQYKPYLLNGEPVVVRTTINVVFDLSRTLEYPQE